MSVKILISDFEAEAVEKSDKMKESLLSIKKELNNKSEGNDNKRLVLSLIVMLLIFAAYYIVLLFLKDNQLIDNYVVIAVTVFVSVVLVSNLVNRILSFHYYGRINSCLRRVTSMQERLTDIRNKYSLLKDSYTESFKSGYNYKLNIPDSITDELKELENEISGIEKVQSGFLHNFQSFLYFVLAMVASLLVLFTDLNKIVIYIGDLFLKDGLDSERLVFGKIVLAVTVIAVTIGTFFLIKIINKKQKFAVTNYSLLSVFAGPVAFGALLHLLGLIALLLAYLFAALIVVVIIVLVVGAVILIAAIFGGG